MAVQGLESHLPLKLDAKISLIHSTLTIRAVGVTYQIHIAKEAAAWIREDQLLNGKPNESTEIPAAEATLTSKGIQVSIGNGPRKLPVFRTVDPGRRGVILERQVGMNDGTAKLPFKEIAL